MVPEEGRGGPAEGHREKILRQCLKTPPGSIRNEKQKSMIKYFLLLVRRHSQGPFPHTCRNSPIPTPCESSNSRRKYPSAGRARRTPESIPGCCCVAVVLSEESSSFQSGSLPRVPFSHRDFESTASCSGVVCTHRNSGLDSYDEGKVAKIFLYHFLLLNILPNCMTLNYF